MIVYTIRLKVKACYHPRLERELSKYGSKIRYGVVNDLYVKNISSKSSRKLHRYTYIPIDIRTSGYTHLTLKRLNELFYYYCEMGELFVYDDSITTGDINYDFKPNIYPELKIYDDIDWIYFLKKDWNNISIEIIDNATGNQMYFPDLKGFAQIMIERKLENENTKKPRRSC